MDIPLWKWNVDAMYTKGRINLEINLTEDAIFVIYVFQMAKQIKIK
jgi:hypothetical protein